MAKKLGIATRKVRSYRVHDATAPQSGSADQGDALAAANVVHHIFLGNLPLAASEKEITEFLSAHGVVVDVRLPEGSKGDRNRGYAFAILECPGTTTEVVTLLDGQNFYERRLRVGPDHKSAL